MNKNKGVEFVRKEIEHMLPKWEVIRDCLGGEDVIKDKGTKYLPYPSSHCEDDMGNPITFEEVLSGVARNDYARYKAYLKRANFVNAVGRTANDLLGQVFIKDPVCNVADKDIIIDRLLRNASGNGVSLIQSARRSMLYTVCYAYSGIFVDFPDTNDKAISIKEYDTGHYRPTITTYSPFEIKNFKIENIGVDEKLTLVVLGETYNEYDEDGFEISENNMYRVLKLVNGEYIQEIWKPSGKTHDGKGLNFKKVKTIKPTDVNGKPMNEIPFYFMGIENNNPYPDMPIMYDLATINIAHYRNSADYEQTMFICGQPTIVLSGYQGGDMTTQGGNQNNQIRLGVEHAILLENGGTSSLLQAKSDSGLAEAMRTKQDLMINFGAKFLEEDSVSKTAYQVKVETQANSSILANCAMNVSNAYTQALVFIHEICKLSSSEEIKFELNTDFEYNRLGSDEINTATSLYLNGGIAYQEWRDVLRRAGLATLDDNTALQEYEKRKTEQQKLETKTHSEDSHKGGIK